MGPDAPYLDGTWVFLRMFLLTGNAFTDDVDSFPALVELHLSINQGEDGIVVAETYPAAWEKFCTDLPHDDVSGTDVLTAIFFHSPALSVGVASISARPLSLFMCHCPVEALIMYDVHPFYHFSPFGQVQFSCGHLANRMKSVTMCP